MTNLYSIRTRDFLPQQVDAKSPPAVVRHQGGRQKTTVKLTFIRTAPAVGTPSPICTEGQTERA